MNDDRHIFALRCSECGRHHVRTTAAPPYTNELLRKAHLIGSPECAAAGKGTLSLLAGGDFVEVCKLAAGRT